VKLLLDGCIWGKAAEELRAAGHDVVWIGDWPEDRGDDVILATANAQQRICVTIDKDFGELAVRRRQSHRGILRIVGFSARRHAEVCLAALAAHGEELLAGGLVTAEPGRLRIRPPEAPDSGATQDVSNQ
jgi:predicted nuclease of predicted toxin-antitoxin system